jgi:hypothetical protein
MCATMGMEKNIHRKARNAKTNKRKGLLREKKS